MYLIRSNPVMVHPDLFSKLGEWIGKQIQDWMQGFLQDSIKLITNIVPSSMQDASYGYYTKDNYSALSFQNVANRNAPVDQAIIPGMNYFFLAFQTIGWIFLACLFITQLYRTFFSSMTGSQKASPTNAFGRLILAGVMMVLSPQIIDWMCKFGDRLMHWVSVSMESSLGISVLSNIEIEWTQTSFGHVLMSCIFCGVLAYNIFMAYLNQVERFVVFGITVQLFPLASAMFGTQEHEDSARNYYLMLFSQMFAILMNNMLFVLLIYRLNHMGDNTTASWIVAIALCSIAKSSERLLNAIGLHAMPTPESARNFASGVIGVGSMASAGVGMATAGIRAGASMVGGARSRLFGNAGATARSSGSAGSVGGAVKGLANSSNHVLSPKESAIKSLAKMGADGKLTRGDMNKALMENGFISGNTTALGRAMARGVQSLPGGAIYGAKKEMQAKAAMANAIRMGKDGIGTIAGTNSASVAKALGIKAPKGFEYDNGAIKRNANGSFTFSGFSTDVKSGASSGDVTKQLTRSLSSKQIADLTGASTAMPNVNWSNDAAKINAAGNMVMTGTSVRQLRDGNQMAFEGSYEFGNKADLTGNSNLRKYVPLSEDGSYGMASVVADGSQINRLFNSNNQYLAETGRDGKVIESGEVLNSSLNLPDSMNFNADHGYQVDCGMYKALVVSGNGISADGNQVGEYLAILPDDAKDHSYFEGRTQFDLHEGERTYIGTVGEGDDAVDYFAYHITPKELDADKQSAQIDKQNEIIDGLFIEDAKDAGYNPNQPTVEDRRAMNQAFKNANYTGKEDE